MIGDYPLVRFLYIQECLSREVTPTVVVISVNSVQGRIFFFNFNFNFKFKFHRLVDNNLALYNAFIKKTNLSSALKLTKLKIACFLSDPDNIYKNLDDFNLSSSRQSFSTLTLRKNKGKYLSSWTIDDRFSLKVCAITRLNTDVNRAVEVSQPGTLHCKNVKLLKLFAFNKNKHVRNIHSFVRLEFKSAYSMAVNLCANLKKLPKMWYRGMGESTLRKNFNLTYRSQIYLEWLDYVLQYMKYQKVPKVLKLEKLRTPNRSVLG